MEVLLTLAACLALLGTISVGGYAAFYVGRSMVQDILSNPNPMPAWLEAVAPLKGRWFRLFVSAPGVVICVLVIFGLVVCYLGTALATVVFIAAGIVQGALS